MSCLKNKAMDPEGAKWISDAMKEQGEESNIHFVLDVVGPWLVHTTISIAQRDGRKCAEGANPFLKGTSGRKKS